MQISHSTRTRARDRGPGPASPGQLGRGLEGQWVQAGPTLPALLHGFSTRKGSKGSPSVLPRLGSPGSNVISQRWTLSWLLLPAQPRDLWPLGLAVAASASTPAPKPLLSLQAGDKHYHPLCAVCVRCGRTFAEGEEMYLQGEALKEPFLLGPALGNVSCCPPQPCLCFPFAKDQGGWGASLPGIFC